MFQGVYLTLVLLTAVWIGATESLKCYHCRNVPNPLNCLSMTVCEENENCFTETEEIGLGTNPVYNLGCRISTECQGSIDQNLLSVVGRKIEKRSTQTSCSQCCGVDACNDKLCNHLSQTTQMTSPRLTTIPKSTSSTTAESTMEEIITTTTPIPTSPSTTHIPTMTKTTPVSSTTTPLPTTHSTSTENMATSTPTTRAPVTHALIYVISTTTPLQTTSVSLTTPTTPLSTTQSTSTVKKATSTSTTRASVTLNELSRETPENIRVIVNMCPQLVQEFAKDDNNVLTTYGHNCYEIVTQVATWNHSEDNCRQKGGHLVHINSQAEQTFINNFSQSSNFHHTFWIGLHDQNHESHFQWVSGNSVTYTDFYHHGIFDLQFHGLEDCVVMSKTHNGQWDDRECDNEFYNYICQYPTVDSSTIHVTTPDPSMISEGNIHLCPSAAQHDASQNRGVVGQYESSCYELLPVLKVTWDHGEAHCKQLGGHLAHISNAQEQAFIQRFMTAHFPNHAVWIGLHDSNVEGHFQWTSGNAVQYTNWVPGHTSNFVSHREEDCVAFIPYQNGQWDDIPCGGQGIFGGDSGETHPVLCQYKISASVVPVGK